jgi:hypothetical protein
MADTKISALPASTTPLGGTEVLPIVQSGATVKVSVANLTAGRVISANGVTFPATASLSSDPNTLDDYEEGTWTPTVIALTGTITSYTSSGVYTKIGRQVVIAFDFTITDNGTGAGTIAMQGLPFPVSAAYNAVGVCRDIGLSSNNGVVLNVATATLNMQTIINTYIGGTGARVVGTLCYTA